MSRASRFLAAFSLIFGTLASPTKAQVSIDCSPVLDASVFNVGSTNRVETFAGSYQSAMCNTVWESRAEAERRSRDLGVNFGDLSRSIGLNWSDNEDSTQTAQNYQQFCGMNASAIAYSSAFFTTYRDSDVAVNAWRECVALQADGSFALIKPDLSLTGAVVLLTRRVSQGEVPALDIQSIESIPADSVTCTSGTFDATEATFPEGDRDASITCSKPANRPVQFFIDTNWGNYGPFTIPGYSDSLESVQLDIARLRQEMATADGALSMRVGTIESGGSSCSWTEPRNLGGGHASPIQFSCPAGQYMRSARVSFPVNAYFWQQTFSFECCTLR